MLYVVKFISMVDTCRFYSSCFRSLVLNASWTWRRLKMKWRSVFCLCWIWKSLNCIL